jgi:hypothetical protein
MADAKLRSWLWLRTVKRKLDVRRIPDRVWWAVAMVVHAALLGVSLMLVIKVGPTPLNLRNRLNYLLLMFTWQCQRVYPLVFWLASRLTRGHLYCQVHAHIQCYGSHIHLPGA